MPRRRPLVLVPGLLCDRLLWRHQVAALSGVAELLGRRPHAIRFDRRRSDRRPARRAERGRFLGVSDALLPLFLHRDKIADPELVNTVKTMARNIGQAAFIRHERTVMSRPDSRPGLWEISRPTLVLCCREDAVTPPDVHEELAAGITHSRLEIIQDCGHLSALERPAEVSAALRRWLAAS